MPVGVESTQEARCGAPTWMPPEMHAVNPDIGPRWAVDARAALLDIYKGKDREGG